MATRAGPGLAGPGLAGPGRAAQGMPPKAVVEVEVPAVACPGVFLPEKHDIFLSVFILGQLKETECLPTLFPFLFHEKMCFEKVFESAIDPAVVTEMLESNILFFSGCVFVLSVGNDLAFYEENTQDFLFPECKLTPAYPGVDKELLMKTSPHFTGIAPKIEFSTRTTITELSLQYRRENYVDSSKSLSEVTSPLPYHKGKESVPLCNRYEALQVEDQSAEDVDNSPSIPVVLRGSERPTPPYQNRLHEEEKMGYNCRQLPSEGNRGSNMPDRPSS
ncbi:spermatogenesis associated 6-like protein [Morus bassanus]